MGTGLVVRLWRDESGQDIAEYALLLALLAVVILPILVAFGDTIADSFDASEDCLRPAFGGETPADGGESFGQCKHGD